MRILPFMNMLAYVSAFHLYAGDPTLENPSPEPPVPVSAPASTATNSAGVAQHRVHPVPTRQARAAAATNTAPQKLLSSPSALPIYIITEMVVVNTPQGSLALVDQADMVKLAHLFGGATKVTNFAIYTK